MMRHRSERRFIIAEEDHHRSRPSGSSPSQMCHRIGIICRVWVVGRGMQTLEEWMTKPGRWQGILRSRVGGASRPRAQYNFGWWCIAGELVERNTEDRKESEARPPQGAGSRRGLGQSPNKNFLFYGALAGWFTGTLCGIVSVTASFVSIGLVTRESLRQSPS